MCFENKQVLPWADTYETNENSEYNWAVQSTTIQGLLKAGHDFLLNLASSSRPTVRECSKRGDLLFLQIVVDELVNVGEIEDVVVVPVTVAHDNPVFRQEEGPHNIWNLCKLLFRRVFTSAAACSMARVDFEQPVSSSPYLNRCRTQNFAGL